MHTPGTVDTLGEGFGTAMPHMISEKANAAVAKPRGRPRTRVVLEDVPRLHLPSMIAAGQVVPDECTRTDRAWSTSNGGRLLVAVVAEMKAHRGQLVMQPVEGRCYLLQVVSDPQPFGGRRWWLVCPVTGRRASALYQPPGALRFASRESHGLSYRTQRLDAAGRARQREAAG